MDGFEETYRRRFRALSARLLTPTCGTFPLDYAFGNSKPVSYNPGNRKRFSAKHLVLLFINTMTYPICLSAKIENKRLASVA
jgi:hypothetical protein